MIPLRIACTNFGAIESMDIDLRGLTLAAVIGPNGYGKSTGLTIAPLFALYGLTKNGCSLDDMVRTGAEECVVSYEFEHQEAIYLVIRTRSKKGRGKTTLEFQQKQGDSWISKSGATVAETEAIIQKLLGADPNVLINTSFILQGRANEFTAKTKGERKAILAEILQLDIYQDLQDKAKAKASVINIAVEQSRSKISDTKQAIENAGQVDGFLTNIETDIQETNGDITTVMDEISGWEDKLRTIKTTLDEQAKIQFETTNILNDIDRKKILIESSNQKIAAAKRTTDMEQDITIKADRAAEVRDIITLLKVKQEQQSRIAINGKNKKLELTKQEMELERLNKQIADIENKLTIDTAGIIEKYTNLTTQLNNTYTQNNQYQELIQKTTNLKSEIKELEHTVQDIAKDRAILERKTEMLATVNCVDIENAQCQFLADAKAAKQKLSITKDGEGEKQEIEVKKVALSDIEKQLTTHPGRPEVLQQIQQQITTIKPQYDEAMELDKQRLLLKNLKEQKPKLMATVEVLKLELASLKDEYYTLQEEIRELPDLESELQELSVWVDLKAALPAAKQIIISESESIKILTNEIDRLDQQVKALEIKLIDTGTFTKDRIEAEMMLDGAKKELSEMQTKLAILQRESGRLSAVKEKKDKDVKLLAELQQKITPRIKELTRYQTLIKAFGKDGIPALIIENAVPELERISNEILEKMTGGKHSLRFETQKEVKSRSGVAEALEIIVSDWAGDRPYETFSGGEQLRIDYAIRFALSEILARRAGSRIEWLCIDEGLGSQDAYHRALVLEAIKNVADRFRIVTIITHIEEAKAVFDQQIVFNGKTVEVVA